MLSSYLHNFKCIPHKYISLREICAILNLIQPITFDKSVNQNDGVCSNDLRPELKTTTYKIKYIYNNFICSLCIRRICNYF